MEIYVIMGKVRKRKHIEKCYLLSNDFFLLFIMQDCCDIKNIFYVIFSNSKFIYVCVQKIMISIECWDRKILFFCFPCYAESNLISQKKKKGKNKIKIFEHFPLSTYFGIKKPSKSYTIQKVY